MSPSAIWQRSLIREESPMIPNKEVHIEKSRDLLKRGKKGLLHLVFSRTGIMALLV